MTTKKQSTIKTDLGRINGHIRPLVGKKKISSLTRRDVEQLLADVAEGKTARDIRTEKGRSIITGGKAGFAEPDIYDFQPSDFAG